MALMPDLAVAKTLRGSDLLEAVSASLLYEAARIRSIECVLRPEGWDEQRADAHNALCAAAASDSSRLLGVQPSTLHSSNARRFASGPFRWPDPMNAFLTVWTCADRYAIERMSAMNSTTPVILASATVV